MPVLRIVAGVARLLPIEVADVVRLCIYDTAPRIGAYNHHGHKVIDLHAAPNTACCNRGAHAIGIELMALLSRYLHIPSNDWIMRQWLAKT